MLKKTKLVNESGMEERIDQVFSFIDNNQIKEPEQIKDDIRYYLPASCKKDFISLYNSCLVNDVSDADIDSYRPGANPCITGDLEIRYKGDKPPKAIMSGPTIGTGPFVDDKWYGPVESGELECDSYIRFCEANVIRPDDDWLYMEPVDTLTHIVLFIDDSNMMNESAKVTLTIGQLKKLVKEAYAPQYVKDAVYEACNEINAFMGYLDEDARTAFKKFKEILDRTW